MNLTATSSLAGKTLTLYVYDLSVDNQTLYDINTGITVTVEKQDLKDVASFDGIGTLTYKGFSQSVDTSKVILKKEQLLLMQAIMHLHQQVLQQHMQK